MKLDSDRLANAIREEKKRKMRGEEVGDRFTKRTKGPEGGSHDVTEEELGDCLLRPSIIRPLTSSTEAYRMNRRQTEDPMANYIDTEY